MQVPYLYRPIAAFNGQVLKACSIATPTSRAIVQARADGIDRDMDGGTLLINGVVVETPDYAGDRIYAGTLKSVESLDIGTHQEGWDAAYADHEAGRRAWHTPNPYVAGFTPCRLWRDGYGAALQNIRECAAAGC